MTWVFESGILHDLFKLIETWLGVMTDWQVQTNERLFYATQLLSIEQLYPITLAQHEQRAVYGSVYLFLSQTWLIWLQELSTYINVSLDGWTSLNCFPAKDLPESQYLLSFKDDPESWLSLLLLRVDTDEHGIVQMRSFSSPQSQLVNNIKRVDLIAVDGPNKPESEQKILSRIIVEFKQYMQSVRSRQVEW